MAAAPLSALDLPLKLLVWADDEGGTQVSYTDPAVLGRALRPRRPSWRPRSRGSTR